MSHRTIAAACAFALAATIGAAHAKTFVYCSEGSPEGFSPMLFTSGTTFDANRPIYDRLVEFKPGTTEVEPMLAEILGRLRGRHDLHLPPAPQREVAVERQLQADPRLQRRRRSSSRSSGSGRTATRTTRSRRRLRILRRHEHAEAARRASTRSTTTPSRLRSTFRTRRSCRTWRWISPRSCRRNTPIR